MAGPMMVGGEGSSTLSVVVPAHNCAGHLAETIDLLQDGLPPGRHEVIIVENGSKDDTWVTAQRLAQQQGRHPVIAVQSPLGLGNAYAAGIRLARGEFTLLTADDLPFGCSDLDAWCQAGPRVMVLGSKAHRDSRVQRNWQRTALSAGFRVLRRVVLGMRVRDCQGTVIARTSWLQGVLPLLHEEGYLFSTELTFLAQVQGEEPLEVPVVLRAAPSGTRIRVPDVVAMAVGLVGLRHRRADFAAAPRTLERMS